MASPSAEQLGAAIRRLRETRNPTWEVLGTIADGIGVEVIEIVGLAGQLPAGRPTKKRS